MGGAHSRRVARDSVERALSAARFSREEQVTNSYAQPDMTGAHPFAALGLAAPFVRAVASEGYSKPTPVQERAIPHVLEGRDVLGCAQTGTGKTAAFALPILQRLAAKPAPAAGTPRRVRCLVLCPTRELATQIGDSFRTYGKNLNLRHAVIFR